MFTLARALSLIFSSGSLATADRYSSIFGDGGVVMSKNLVSIIRVETLGSLECCSQTSTIPEFKRHSRVLFNQTKEIEVFILFFGLQDVVMFNQIGYSQYIVHVPLGVWFSLRSCSSTGASGSGRSANRSRIPATISSRLLGKTPRWSPGW